MLNNVKQKMEGIGDVTQNGHAPGNNIMGAEEGIGSKILGGAALIAAMWGVNNHLANQAYEASPQLQKLTQFYQQAEAQHDTVKMKELSRRIADHKMRLDLGHGDVMDKTGNPKEIVPETGDEKNPQHSHQYDTTMKHADNPSVQQRMAAHDIKPGIAGYRDRIAMLKDLERTGKLKSEDISAFEDIMKLAGLAK
jgi:hypothetical protein